MTENKLSIIRKKATMAEFKKFLLGDTKWPGITAYRASIGLTTDWEDFDENKPRLSEQTKSNLLKAHILNASK
jgi:hypothetical protein|tara:strand:+ start:434 stop:652 length:219 start_codon:yes stop_codon:yes gene_type:complete